jgi:hypothetical protein
MSAMTVQVTDQISALDVSITCPNVTTTSITVTCIFTTARGTDLTANFNYNTSDSMHSILNVPGKKRFLKLMNKTFLFHLDAQYYTFGSPYVTNNPTTDLSVNLLSSSDIAILPQSTITVAGRIGSVQFYSSGAGSVTIYVNKIIPFFSKNIILF